MEWSFLEDMRSSRKQYCESVVDRRWRKTMERKISQEKSLDERREKQIAAQIVMSDVSLQTESETNNESTDNDDSVYVHSVARGQKRPFVDTSASIDDDLLSNEHRHIRKSAHVIKPEFYRTVDQLISKYHCFKTQAIGAVIETVKIMFGRTNWKFHLENQELIDLDTAPEKKC